MLINDTDPKDNHHAHSFHRRFLAFAFAALRWRCTNHHCNPDRHRRRTGGRRSAHHTSPEEAGEVFRRAAPKPAVFSHIVFGRQGEEALIRRTGYNGPLIVGADGMRIVVGETVTVLPQ